MNKENLVIATIKSWNISNGQILKEKIKDKYNLEIITDKNQLKYHYIKKLSPKYLFFPHWSWIIPEKIYKNFECVVFHLTDLPFGRGGSPLQNLITRKVYNTKISAIRVVKGIDSGDIYLKEPFYIGLGSADEIFQKVSEIIFNKMIPNILENKPNPYLQEGEPVNFKRRKPEESNILESNVKTLDDIYDFIRMLDGEDYPNAFIQIGNLKINFKNVCRKTDKLIGNFEIIDFIN